MNRVFLELFNLSMTAAWLILAVLFLRLVLKKAPKWLNCFLWIIVALRLIFPFDIESAFSLVPSVQTVPVEIEMMETPTVNTGITAIDNVINPVITEKYTPDVGESVNPLQIVISVASRVWIGGVIVLLLYAFFSFIRLKRKVAISTKTEDGIYRCDEIDSPFILGLFRPAIYIPSDISPATYEFVLSHERAHLTRRDYFWKPLGYLLLAVYWFQPLCWVAYVIFCKDIELACDEKATRDMDKSARADYCQALLSCSVHHKMIAACPVAFGEAAVKERVKRVLYYKKPSFWIIMAAVIACIAAAVCFLTSPEDETENSSESLNVETENNEESTESVQEEGPNERYTKFLEKWANAFCDRDGQTIVDMSASQVAELLYQGDGYVSFGYSSPWPMWGEGEGYVLLNQDDLNRSGEILYYAWTSDPHVTVWKEYISFEEINGELMVTSEELHYFDNIASGMEFDEAYPAITGTLMDYSVNGMGEALISNVLRSATLDVDLQDPVLAAKKLLNLLDNENKVKVEQLQDDSQADVVNLKITFLEDGAERLITMEKLGSLSWIWIPKNYTTAGNDVEAVISRVLQQYFNGDKFEPVSWNNTMDWKEDSDILIHMATDSTGRYAAYGISSKEYGDYGIVINDTIDGTDNNTNYCYLPWFYTGAPTDEPAFAWVDNQLFFTYPVEVNGASVRMQLAYVDCGYDTAHAELITFPEPEIEEQIGGLISLEKEGKDVKCISKENNQVFAILTAMDSDEESEIEIAFYHMFFIPEVKKLVVGVQETGNADMPELIGYLSFDFNLENAETGFTLSNPGTYRYDVENKNQGIK